MVRWKSGPVSSARVLPSTARARPCVSSSPPATRPCTNRRLPNELKLSMGRAPILADSYGIRRDPVNFQYLGALPLRQHAGLLRSRDAHARVTFVELFFDLV